MGSLPHHRNTPSALSTTPSSKVAQLIGRAPPSPAPTNSFEEDYRTSINSGRPHINDIMREVDRDTPGGPTDRTPSRKSSRSNISRQRSKKNAMFYADAFAFRDAGVPVPSIAPVLVELKTNVIVSILKPMLNFAYYSLCRSCIKHANTLVSHLLYFPECWDVCIEGKICHYCRIYLWSQYSICLTADVFNGALY
jgi:hypothetical protein